jgi:hypothetical protein
MGKRRLLTDPAFSAADLQLLASEILNYVDESVRVEHAVAHEWHHMGNPLFFDGHRQFIGNLESWLVERGLSQFVPLPKWDPATRMPKPFEAVKLLPAVTQAGFGPNIENPAPNRPAPNSVADLSRFSTPALLSADSGLQNWHGNVHVAVGGAMRSIDVSPCAAIFWPWHAFIDDIYEDWLRLHSPVGEVSFTAAWRPGTEGEIQVYGWSYDDYRTKYDELWPHGWRLKFLRPYVVNDQVFYSAAWEPSTEGEIQVYGWSYDDYRAKYDELWPQGWRLKFLQPYVVNGEVFYTAAWRPSTEGEIQVYGWSYDDYRAKYDELWPQGWRLKILQIF